MLAQSFKTAAELGLTDLQYEGLCKALVVLETDQITHLTDVPDTREDHSISTDIPKFFNMAHWDTGTECGTVCCIGGLASALMGELFLFSTRPKSQLDNLFFPHSLYPLMCDWYKITPAMAAATLRRYLETGRTVWK